MNPSRSYRVNECSFAVPFAVDDDVALSMGRGGGKTTFVAALACAIREPRRARFTGKPSQRIP